MSPSLLELTSVIFVGDPGVGKSTIHNALGGTFKNGYNPVVGMPVGDPQEVICEGRRLLLVDVPGIRDHNVPGDYSTGESAIDRNLRTLQTRLNEGGAFVVFFVIVPHRNGTVDKKDLALMKLFLSSLECGPKVGIIFTQIRKPCLEKVQDPDFVRNTVTSVGVNTRFLDTENYLALSLHEEEFSAEDEERIRKFILSFTPQPVQIREMLSTELDPLGGGIRIMDGDRAALQIQARDLRMSHYEEVSGTQHLVHLFAHRPLDIVRRTFARTDSETTSVFLFGMPNIDKNMVLNALGGQFSLETKEFNLCEGDPLDLTCRERPLRLIDMPFPDAQGPYGPAPATYFYLQKVCDRLNDGHSYVMFFVISLKNGRMEPADIGLMMLVLNNMKRGPKIGLIFTDISSRKILGFVQDPSYFSQLTDFLKQHKADLSFLSMEPPLTILRNDKLSDQEQRTIQDYILSFHPRRVRIKAIDYSDLMLIRTQLAS